MSLGLSAVAVAAALLVVPVFAGLAHQWIVDPVSAYGLVLAIAAGYALRRRWPLLRAAQRSPSTIGFLLLLACLALHALASLAGEQFVLRLSTVAIAAALLLTLCGPLHLRLAATPCPLCALAVPLPATVVASLTLPLQLLASNLAANVLAASGATVVRTGNLLTLSNVTLEVVESCSGLHSIVALLSLITVARLLGAVPPWRAATLAALAVPVAIAGNALRIASSGGMALMLGPWAARGLLDEITGLVAFCFMCVLLVTANSLLTGTASPPVVETPCDSPATA